ncbi:MAG: glycosyltransferase family 4 protein [Akkermansiaceae bacterium]|nr:glycosyltransferase family 4 protein [Akkermansiaceae bacterium]
MPQSVIIIQEHLPEFRVGFYELLRRKLADQDIALELVYAPNQKNNFLKGNLSWAKPVPIRWIGGGLGWQSVLGLCRGKDLVVIQQETKYLVNPLLQLWSAFGGPKIAYWGHGKNFQAEAVGSLANRLKAWLSKRVDWWFAYNRLSGNAVRDLGFPSEQITEVMNAVDTKSLRDTATETPQESLDALKSELGINSDRVAIYTGGLYKRKRIEFLIAAAQIIQKEIPDFHLIVIGDGPDAGIVEKAARTHPWIHFVGPKNDGEKVPYWMISKVLLIPGLVGLVIVDSFALGVPLVTTDYPFHSPEIDYLENGENGVLVNCGESVEIYAAEISSLLLDVKRLQHLRENALSSADSYSFEVMSDRFADGVMNCLARSGH